MELVTLTTVIPAKAGIPLAAGAALKSKLGPGLRRGDGVRWVALPSHRRRH